MDSLLLRRRMLAGSGNEGNLLPYHCKNNLLSIDPTLHQYFLERIYQITGTWLDDGVTYIIFKGNANHEDWYYEGLNWIRGVEYYYCIFDRFPYINISTPNWHFNNFQLYDANQPLTASCSLYFHFIFRDYDSPNKWILYRTGEGRDFTLFGDATNHLRTYSIFPQVWYNDFYPIYCSKEIHAIDSNGVDGILLAPRDLEYLPYEVPYVEGNGFSLYAPITSYQTVWDSMTEERAPYPYANSLTREGVFATRNPNFYGTGKHRVSFYIPITEEVHYGLNAGGVPYDRINIVTTNNILFSGSYGGERTYILVNFQYDSSDGTITFKQIEQNAERFIFGNYEYAVYASSDFKQTNSNNIMFRP